MKSAILSRVLFALAVFALAVALTLGIVNIARAESITVLPNTAQQAGILVCGQGTADTHPDQAQIEAGVQATASTAEEARNQAAAAMSAVLAAIKAEGVAAADVQTDYFAIEPAYDYSSGSPHITGYTASNSVTVTVRAVDKTGAVVDAVTQAGGDDVLVNGIEFSNGNPAATLEQAQQNALANAQQQAKAAAAASGVSLGAPLSIDLNGCGSSTVVSPLPATANGAVSSASSGTVTPVSPGQIEVTADVGVDYAVH